jgi:hypothetical protein
MAILGKGSLNLRMVEALIILLSLVCRKSEMPIKYFHGERFATVAQVLSGNWTIRTDGNGFREGRSAPGLASHQT